MTTHRVSASRFQWAAADSGNECICVRGAPVSDLVTAACSAEGPFPDVDALLDRADRVLAELPDAELDVALDGHPRIGAKVDNESSAREQAGVADADETVRAELAERNREYDDKFGYVYLARASGRSAEELLAILTDRLHNDPETQRRVMRNELAKINRLRLQRLLSEPHDGPGSKT